MKAAGRVVVIPLVAAMTLLACSAPSEPDPSAAMAGDNGGQATYQDGQGNGITVSGDSSVFYDGTQIKVKPTDAKPAELSSLSYIAPLPAIGYDLNLKRTDTDLDGDIDDLDRAEDLMDVEVTSDPIAIDSKHILLAASFGRYYRDLVSVKSRPMGNKTVYSFQVKNPGVIRFVSLDVAAMGDEIIKQAQPTPPAGAQPDCRPDADYSFRPSGTLVEAGKTLYPCVEFSGEYLSLWSRDAPPLVATNKPDADNVSVRGWTLDDSDTQGAQRFRALQDVNDDGTLNAPLMPGSMVSLRYKKASIPERIVMKFSPSLGFTWGLQNQLGQLLNLIRPDEPVRSTVRTTVIGGPQNQNCYRNDITWVSPDPEVPFSPSYRQSWMKDKMSCVLDGMERIAADQVGPTIQFADSQPLFTHLIEKLDEIIPLIYPAVDKWASPLANTLYVLRIDKR